MAMLPLFQESAEARAALEKLMPQALEVSAWGRERCHCKATILALPVPLTVLVVFFIGSSRSSYFGTSLLGDQAACPPSASQAEYLAKHASQGQAACRLSLCYLATFRCWTETPVGCGFVLAASWLISLVTGNRVLRARTCVWASALLRY